MSVPTVPPGAWGCKHFARSRRRAIAGSITRKSLVCSARANPSRLVKAALYTGCRYGELCRAAVSDYDPTRNTLRVPVTKTGRGRDVFLNDEAANFFASIIAGRPGTDRLLTRSDAGGANSAPWGASHQARRIRDACERGGVSPPISFHGLRHTYASLAVEAGMTLIALARNLGHTDTRMVERHYGHLSDRYLHEQVRRFAPMLGPNPDDAPGH